MRQPFTVLVYPVRRTSDGRGWEYLLLRRTSKREGFWQGVTGALERGESLEEAARRELFEETGFVPDELMKVDYSYSFPVADPWRHHYASNVTEITEHVFLAFLASSREPKIDLKEHDRWAWCSFEEALGKLRWPGNLEALKRCEEVVRAKFAESA
jgi:dATP pyrophosphohydrolase